MDDLINRKAAIEAFDRIPLPRIKGLGLELLISVSDAKGMLEGMKAIDAAPVKHGKWNHIGTLERYVGMSVETCSEFRCSVCDSPQTFFVPIAHYNYCPICGAKMDLEE